VDTTRHVLRIYLSRVQSQVRTIPPFCCYYWPAGGIQRASGVRIEPHLRGDLLPLHAWTGDARPSDARPTNCRTSRGTPQPNPQESPAPKAM
jgi:hypothetical protein